MQFFKASGMSFACVSQVRCTAATTCSTFAARVELLYTELVLACTGYSSYLHAQNMLLNLVQPGFSAPQQPGPILLKHCLQQ